ncbi:MAG: hypothetical protein AAGB24_16500 [Bacteroidota bacterium]
MRKRSWKVHCDTDIGMGKTFSMAPDAHQLENYINKYYMDYQVSTVYKAGCCGYSVYRDFESYGWRSLVVNPADVFRRGEERHTKTDAIDAQL